MKLSIVMSNGQTFELITNKEFINSFKVDISIDNWLKLNNYTNEKCEEIYIRKEYIVYFKIKES